MSAEDSIKRAQAAAKKKDARALVAALEDALAQARKDAPLDIRAAVPINHDHTGLGLYTPAKDDKIDGRRVRVYVEVANFATTSTAPGLLRAQLDVSGDFTFEDTSTTPAEIVPLMKGVALGTQAFETRSSAGVTSFGVEIKLGDKSPAGVYKVALTVKDAVGNKSASREVRFVLV